MFFQFFALLPFFLVHPFSLSLTCFHSLWIASHMSWYILLLLYLLLSSYNFVITLNGINFQHVFLDLLSLSALFHFTLYIVLLLTSFSLLCFLLPFILLFLFSLYLLLWSIFLLRLSFTYMFLNCIFFFILQLIVILVNLLMPFIPQVVFSADTRILLNFHFKLLLYMFHYFLFIVLHYLTCLLRRSFFGSNTSP